MIELETSNSVYKFLVPVGRHDKVFEKKAHAQRVAAIEPFGFEDIAEKRKELWTSNFVYEFLVPVGRHNKVIDETAPAQYYMCHRTLKLSRVFPRNEKSF